MTLIPDKIPFCIRQTPTNEIADSSLVQRIEFGNPTRLLPKQKSALAFARALLSSSVEETPRRGRLTPPDSVGFRGSWSSLASWQGGAAASAGGNGRVQRQRTAIE